MYASDLRYVLNELVMLILCDGRSECVNILIRFRTFFINNSRVLKMGGVVPPKPNVYHKLIYDLLAKVSAGPDGLFDINSRTPVHHDSMQH